MNKVYEAIDEDGRHALVSPATIRTLVVQAKRQGSPKGLSAYDILMGLLANFMAQHGYVALTEIAYSCNGQRRTPIIDQL